MSMVQVDKCMLVDIGVKFYSVLPRTHLGELEVKVTDLDILCLSFWLKYL